MDSYRAMQRASVIVVMIGTNDVGQGRQPQYREVLAKVPPAVPVVLASAPPMVGADMRAQAALARAACAADSRCTFVDAFAALDGKPGMFLPDGVHLTPAGYAVLVPLLREAVRGSHISPSAPPPAS
jgi:lysophospholipase L1-like esterase